MNFATLKIFLVLIAAVSIQAALLGREEKRFAIRKLAWLMPGLFLFAMLLPSIYALMIVLIALPAIVSRTKGEAAAVWLIMILSMPRLSFQLTAGSAYLFDFDAYRCINIGFLLAVMIKPGAKPPRRGRMDFPVILYLLLQAFVDLRSGSATDITRALVMDILSVGVPYFAFTRSIANSADIRRVVLALCFGAGVQAIMALFQVYQHWPTYEMINAHFNIARAISQASKMRAGLMRGNGPFPESTSFAWFLAFAMTGLLMSKDMFRSALHWRLAIGMILLGLISTQSREGWLAVALAVPLLDLYRGRTGRAAAAVGAFALAGLLLVGIAQGSDRLGESLGTSGGASSTVDYRQLLWQRGTEEIRRHPLLGRAPKAVLDALSDIRQGEGIIDFVNGYVYYGLVAGLVGVAALILMFLYTIAATLRKRRQFVTDPDYLRAGGLAFTVTIFTMITTFTSGFATQNAIFLFMATALSSAAGGMALRKPRRPIAPAAIA